MNRNANPYFAQRYGHQMSSPEPCASAIQMIPGPSASSHPGKSGSRVLPYGGGGEKFGLSGIAANVTQGSRQFQTETIEGLPVWWIRASRRAYSATARSMSRV